MMDICNKILVSIITVCYNSEKTIEQTVKSVLNQTYKNYEYVIIDGKSTDATLEILKRYEPLFEGKMKIISESDRGIYDAMNKGIEEAHGELIGIINSDDYYENNAIELMVTEYMMCDIDDVVLYGFQRNIKDNREESVVLYHHEFLDKQMITHPTCFVTKAIYEKYGFFNTKYKSSADYEFMLRLYHHGKICFKPVYEIITNFRLGGMSSSQKGYRETAGLQYQYGRIGFVRYMRIVIRSFLYEWEHGIVNMGKKQ